MPSAGRGRPPGPGEKLWRDAVVRAVKRQTKGEGNPQYLDRLADKLVKTALDGDIAALREVGDRLDGKPAQAIVGDANAAPVKIQHIVGWAGQKPEST